MPRDPFEGADEKELRFRDQFLVSILLASAKRKIDRAAKLLAAAKMNDTAYILLDRIDKSVEKIRLCERSGCP
jgi:hypothetical protein